MPTSRRTGLLATFSIIMLMVGAFSVTAQWKRVKLSGADNERLYMEISFLPDNPLYGWACSFDGYVIRTLDGGETWESSNVVAWNSSTNVGPALESVSFLTPFIGYVSGTSGVWKTVDGGQSWKNITPANLDFIQIWGCSFYSPSEGVTVAGGCGGEGQYFFRTTDAGDTWGRSIGNEPGSGMSDVILYPDGLGYAISSGVMWRSDDSGQTWRRFAMSGKKSWNEDIAHIGYSFLVPSSGTSCNGTGAGGELRFSTNNGSSWSTFTTERAMFGTFLLNDSTGWGVGINKGIYYTNDAGKSWQLRNDGVTTDIDDCWFIDDTTGWLAGLGLYRSDFGETTSSVEDETNTAIMVYPQPAHDYVRITVPSRGVRSYRVDIRSMTGNLVYTTTVDSDGATATFSWNDVSSGSSTVDNGTYYVTFTSDQCVYRRRILILH